jgi:uncharacterized protein (TIGR02001 family)
MKIISFLVLCSPSLYAQFSFNAALTSDYVWRGVSQTDEDPAVQAGVDYGHGSGFYIGAWASNVDFGDDTDYELDLYAGFGKEINDWSFDIGYIRYTYNGDADLDFGEVYGGVGYKAFSALLSYDTDNDNYYIEGAYSIDLGKDWAVDLHYGDYTFDFGGDYSDWKVAVSKAIKKFTIEGAYIDTDIDDVDIAEARGVLTVSVEF